MRFTKVLDLQNCYGHKKTFIFNNINLHRCVNVIAMINYLLSQPTRDKQMQQLRHYVAAMSKRELRCQGVTGRLNVPRRNFY